MSDQATQPAQFTSVDGAGPFGGWSARRSHQAGVIGYEFIALDLRASSSDMINEDHVTQSGWKVDDSLERFFHVVNASKGGVTIAPRVTWAGTSAERRRGLLGRGSLSAAEGIYLTPCEWLHTFGMRFPIDVAFLSVERRVLALQHRLKPNRLSKIVLRAEGVLELPEGTLRLTNTEVGDAVQFLNIATRELISP